MWSIFHAIKAVLQNDHILFTVGVCTVSDSSQPFVIFILLWCKKMHVEEGCVSILDIIFID